MTTTLNEQLLVPFTFEAVTVTAVVPTLKVPAGGEKFTVGVGEPVGDTCPLSCVFVIVALQAPVVAFTFNGPLHETVGLAFGTPISKSLILVNDGVVIVCPLGEAVKAVHTVGSYFLILYPVIGPPITPLFVVLVKLNSAV